MNKETKSESDNKWARSHNLEKNNQTNSHSETKKSSNDNEWISTNKN